MGDHEGWAQPSDLLPNGLLPNQESYVSRVLDQDRWSKAEERTAELIARIQPNQPSEQLRNAVADYVQRLIMKCFSCQVFTFGSVPLKTYLPDGDIDLTAFSKNQNLKDTWANEVRIMLENEEKSDNAEFHVKEVQYIQAEVKLIKCLVENIVVDISFNQLGGLCTLCFLEEVDHLINQNHLFKRSIILIKAWCYYESRILGAHHGLISTYALETLVLYIFHVFNSSFTGPLEVLYRFLEFFSNFDWENFCVSLWGPVPIKSLPDMTAESPRKDGGELLLSRLFLDACSSVYAVFPAGQESQNQPFVSKHFNVIDPLRTNNNLGRSVSRGNFFRIRSAFAFGAKRLARLLECPKEEIVSELNQFFLNTWERHGNGPRPDAPTAGLLRLRQLNADHLNRPESTKAKLRSKKKNGSTTSHESGAEENRTSHGSSDQLDRSASEGIPSTSYIAPVSHTQRQKNFGNRTNSSGSDQISWNTISAESVDNDKGQRNSKPDFLVNDAQERYQFARTRSSPELLNTSNEIPSRIRRNRAPEPGKNHVDSAKMEYSGRKNSGPEVSGNHGVRSSTNDPLVLRYNQSHQSVDASSDSNSVSNHYHDDSHFHTFGDELSSLSETMEMHQEEQDMVNMMASSGYHGYNGHAQIPMNMGAPRLPIPVPPSVLASMGFSQRNLSGMLPAGIPLVDPHWHTNMQFPQGVSPSLSHYFRSMGLASNLEENADMGNANQGFTEVNQEHGDQDFWNEHETVSTGDFTVRNRNMHSMQFDSNQNPTLVGQNFVPSSHNSSGSSSMRDQRRFSRESRGVLREDEDDALHHQSNRGREGYPTERTATLRSLTTSNTSSSRSKASSESSWDGSTAKGSKSTRDKRGRKVAPSPTPSTVSGKGKSGWQHEGGSVDQGSSHADDEIDWIPLSTMGTEIGERSARPTSAGSSHIQNHQMPGYELAQVSGSESMLPVAPMVLSSGSRQRVMDNSGVVPFAFYPTGPPVPFLTMLPVYNFPNETGNSEGSSIHFDREEDMESSRLQNIDPAECLDHSSESFGANSMKNGVSMESLEEHRPDILNSDFSSHWQNLQFGRLCQNPRNHGPMLFPSPAMVPPMYLQGNFPWDGPGRPVSSNVNPPYQLISYGPRVVPVAPLQPGSSRPAGVYQRFGDEIPRYRGGTGTYLPNAKAPPPPSPRERQPAVHRNQRVNYNYDHNEHLGDREGNWKPRYSGRQYGRTQSDKGSSRPDRYSQHDNRTNRGPWDSFRHGPYPPQDGPFGNTNSMHSNGPSTNGVHGVYMQTVNSNGVAPNRPGGGVPSFVMLYPYNHNGGGYDSANEQVEFGTLGPVQLSNMNEVSQYDEGSPERGGAREQQRFRGGSALSSPEQPSSPRFQRFSLIYVSFLRKS
ncbi:hypothetical protein ACHQM5_000287 [Ranunculus cassubicifolius]